MNVLLLLVKWKWALLAVGLAVLIAIPVLYVRGAERAKERLVHVEQELGKAVNAAQTNHLALEACLGVNAVNAQQAERERQKAKQAALRIQELERLADASEDAINDHANTLRASGLGCPAIDTDFRAWMLDSAP
jgi:biopolymer transport protein ExbB/TolQ